MSISGLVSGLDTTTLISQLMQLERAPQNQLKTKLSDTKADASAYRTVNSVFTTLQTAAEKLTKAATWSPVKATSSVGTVSVAATDAATIGSSVAFSVTSLASTHALVTESQWSSRTAVPQYADPGAPITFTKTDGTVIGTVPVTAGATLDETVKAVNDAKLGIQASVIQLADGAFRMQLTSASTGAASEFVVENGPEVDAATPAGQLVLAQGTDATLDLGAGLVASSSSNTFTDLLPGTTITVSKADPSTSVTVGVASDPSALTSAIQSLVTAANSAITNINTYSDNSVGSTAVLRGDSSLRALAGQIADAVAFAVGEDGSAAVAGLQLTKDGKLTFDSAAFAAQLKADPEKTRRLLDGSGTDGTAVGGVAQRLLAVAKSATDATTGSLVSLANGKDSQATELQKRIDDWDLRLELRQQTLTRQFTAMESALGTLQNQSSWLSSQLGSLPTWSS
ncbi:flagellar filament capping protein FliD [Blastococcus sp. TF02-9]|uniref:flagellar filament capping protein FliD n=1 Tax=Blastococcus sp. TF02-09 TaxID=2250576 RepID=UPI0013142056|nr:flagellar filament capping protein FliD [Blastococcus sp. TF02-9]